MTHEAYKRFVDRMVTISTQSVWADRIRAHGHPVRTNERDEPLTEEESALKAPFLRLDASDRKVMARALLNERQSALHVFAAFLEWAGACDALSINWQGESFAASPFASMHGDFISRCDGFDWENA